MFNRQTDRQTDKSLAQYTGVCFLLIKLATSLLASLAGGLNLFYLASSVLTTLFSSDFEFDVDLLCLDLCWCFTCCCCSDDEGGGGMGWSSNRIPFSISAENRFDRFRLLVRGVIDVLSLGLLSCNPSK